MESYFGLLLGPHKEGTDVVDVSLGKEFSQQPQKEPSKTYIRRDWVKLGMVPDDVTPALGR